MQMQHGYTPGYAVSHAGAFIDVGSLSITSVADSNSLVRDLHGPTNPADASNWAGVCAYGVSVFYGSGILQFHPNATGRLSGISSKRAEKCSLVIAP